MMMTAIECRVIKFFVITIFLGLRFGAQMFGPGQTRPEPRHLLPVSAVLPPKVDIALNRKVIRAWSLFYSRSGETEEEIER